MFLKDADAEVDFAVDWTEACGGVRWLAGSAWRIQPDTETVPLVAAQAAFGPEQASVRLTGGRVGHVYRVGNLVTFSDGTCDERSLIVRVEER